MIREEAIQIPFRYAAGETSSRFLAALRDEERILASPCPTCRRLLCPAQSFCTRCGDKTGEMVEVGPLGTVTCWTEVPDRGVFGLIRLDKADTPMLHRLLGPAGPWFEGARVRPVFAAKRTGGILDIEGFKLVEEKKP